MDDAQRCTQEQIASRLRKREIIVLGKLADASDAVLFSDVTGGPATMALLYARGLIAPDKRDGAGYVVITKAGQVAWSEHKWRLDTQPQQV